MNLDAYVEQLLDRGLSEQEVADLVARRAIQGRSDRGSANQPGTDDRGSKTEVACSAAGGPDDAQPEVVVDEGSSPELGSTLHLAASIYSYRETSFAGPLPSPELARAYEAILPGATDRLLAIYERDSAAARQSIAESSRRLDRGQVFAFLFALAALTAGVVIAGLGYPVAGTAFGGTTLVAIVTAFLYRSKHIAAVREEQLERAADEDDLATCSRSDQAPPPA